MRAARWETAPTAYCASAPARIIGRLCDGEAPKTPSKTPYQKGRFVAREPRVASSMALADKPTRAVSPDAHGASLSVVRPEAVAPTMSVRLSWSGCLDARRWPEVQCAE